MLGFQRYLFRNVLRTLLAIVGGLALIALLTKGLDQIDLIVDNRQSLLVYLYVSVLGAPQIISLLMPIALFVAITGALNIAHRENEIVVAQASGMSNWGVASPVHAAGGVGGDSPSRSQSLGPADRVSSDPGHAVHRVDRPCLLAGARGPVHAYHSDGLTTFARQVNGFRRCATC